MSPDAAELFAQVDAALLIALAVQGRPPERPQAPDQPGDETFPRRLWESLGVELYSAGLIATLVSLAMTLASVRYGKPLGNWSSAAVSNMTLLGMLAFFMAAIGKAIGAHHGYLERARLWLVAVGCLLGLMIWGLIFVPSFWPWE